MDAQTAEDKRFGDFVLAHNYPFYSLQEQPALLREDAFQAAARTMLSCKWLPKSEFFIPGFFLEFSPISFQHFMAMVYSSTLFVNKSRA